MIFLLTFGDNVEDMTGSVKFALAYLMAGAAAAALHALLSRCIG
jgi:membrane associated rhomboid family serine protease